jgi:hypothetical protein
MFMLNILALNVTLAYKPFFGALSILGLKDIHFFSSFPAPFFHLTKTFRRNFSWAGNRTSGGDVTPRCRRCFGDGLKSLAAVAFSVASDAVDELERGDGESAYFFNRQ